LEGETPLRFRSSLLEDSLPDLLLNQLQTLAQLQRRAESLGAELAALKQHLARAARLPASDASSAAQWYGNESILIVDHDRIACCIAQEILEEFGYRIIRARGSVCEIDPAVPIDLVLLDVPLLDAEHLAEVKLVGNRFATAQLVVSTPLPEGPARGQLRACGVAAFISKPLEPRTLARCIREVLNLKKLGV
jgi:CheY-like chemotaxis protein